MTISERRYGTAVAMTTLYVVGTTRTPRPGEISGVDYTFLGVEEFIALERNGSLLESGLFDGDVSKLLLYFKIYDIIVIMLMVNTE